MFFCFFPLFLSQFPLKILLKVVSSNAGGDESTSAPRTLFQRLPRHMRRRAMSHNVKRLPRLFRPISVNLNKKKKMPSRIWRRRASRLIRVCF